MSPSSIWPINTTWATWISGRTVNVGRRYWAAESVDWSMT